MVEKQATEQQIRDQIRLAHSALKHQVSEFSLQLGTLMLTFAKTAKDQTMHLGNKQGALTAMHEELALRLALIEFIEQLDIDGTNKSKGVKEELTRRHAAVVMNLERSAADVAARAARMIQSCTESRDKGKIVPLGAKARTSASSEHARMMKDLAILGFIQQFGISTKVARRADL